MFRTFKLREMWADEDILAECEDDTNNDIENKHKLTSDTFVRSFHALGVTEHAELTGSPVNMLEEEDKQVGI